MLGLPALAVIETYEFSDPELERRYHQLSQELRCPKCQNQNIADSNAPISQDLRKLLYERLESGASDAEILDDMVGRYGEFVRYRPAAEGATLWLWLAPLLLLASGALLLFVLLRRGRGEAAPPVSDAERERLEAMLAVREGDTGP
ncbi:MAG: cytochrome c-type biogenesis protein [Halieaceae bacterium]|nr:cytochrome c-type biogenesis protein [Halieaceae bacterium]